MQSKSGTKNKPLKVGITGGIGSGKTLVSHMFHLLGVPLYNADDRAKWILANNQKVKEGLIRIFGTQVFEDGSLNRNYISQQVFNDREKLKMLNTLVHPQVGIDFHQWLESKQNHPYVLKEAALLFESGSYKDLDAIITISAPIELRIKRVLARDPQRSEEGILKIIKEQFPEEEKIKKANHVIYNDETTMLIPQVLKLHEFFIQESMVK